KTRESGARSARDAATIAEAFRITAEDRPDEVAIRTRGDAFTITWAKLRDRVDALAGGLAKLGLERGQTIALMLSNRPEFHICDLAAMTLGATPFSIYNTYAPAGRAWSGRGGYRTRGGRRPARCHDDGLSARATQSGHARHVGRAGPSVPSPR